MEILKTLKFLSIVLLCFFLIIYVLIISYVYFNQVELVFHSSRLPKDYKFDYQQKFEEINIKSFDGTILNGLLFKAENSKGLIFYLHGNAGTLETWGKIAKVYTSLGYDIFILDYRSFGKSEGEIENEEQLSKDISIVYQSMTKRYPEDKIIIAGYSIGSGFAAKLAFENKPKSLLLQAPYYNFLELSSKRVPMFPNFMKKFSLETNVYLPQIKAPIYIFHGTADQLIPFDNSVRLKKLLKSNAAFYPLKNQEHIGVNENEDFQNQLKTILE
ncbi:alpha/beta hydrolase [Flavobacterium sp. WLB]|uniref:alpha/beta hydrolase n=1 Tax=unclassified Flavobacterium TaxID=196869 RepID=UPI0006ABC087|nr:MULTISPECIES: alpha/beta fold hydrolase [unclassified Flavobacterium]KOP36140.1 hydrolase [Flavobacterium sp. VMW]OWU88595.1 hydrolase [Flavobacterium sp. NLM]PUU69093.1 alpha/beta hydrolase [Flavobacterium sp. WLB]